MQHLAVEFGWRFLGYLVWELAALRLDNVRFSGRNAVGLGVFALADSLLNSLLVRPSRVFVLNQPLRRRLVLALRARHVVAIEDVVDSRHRGSFAADSSSPSRYHFIHNLLEFLLHFFGLLSQVLVSYLGLAAIVLENSLNIHY